MTTTNVPITLASETLVTVVGADTIISVPVSPVAPVQANVGISSQASPIVLINQNLVPINVGGLAPAVTVAGAQDVLQVNTAIPVIPVRLVETIVTDIPGPQGNQGLQGAPGLDGADGLDGPPGRDGAKGDQGLQGVPGVAGGQGPIGLAGQDGEDGYGFPGVQGPIGPQGLQGNPGNDGTNGLPGIGLPGQDGDDGLPGPPGAQGLQGTAGAKGDKGDQGNTGDPGIAGADGAKGLPGSAGIGLPGDDGDDGSQGPPGMAGIQGVQGVQGNAGATGAQGSQGPAGTFQRGEDGQDAWPIPGPPGAAGAPGAAGSQGPQGLPGFCFGLPGDDGDDGQPGQMGPQGFRGPVGITGTDGIQGLQGPPGIGGEDGDTWPIKLPADFNQQITVNYSLGSYGFTINRNGIAAPTTFAWTGDNSVIINGKDGVANRINAYSYGAATVWQTNVAAGTQAVPLALTKDQGMMQFSGFGYIGSAYSPAGNVIFAMFAAEAWGTGHVGTYAQMYCTPIGSSTIAPMFRWQASGGASLGSRNVAIDGGNGVFACDQLAPLTVNPTLRNILVNGGFDVWNRGAGDSSSIAVAASTTAYTADRWYLKTGATQAHVVSAVTSLGLKGRLAAKIQRTAGQTGTTAIVFGYPLTTDECKQLRGQTLALQYLGNSGANFSPTAGTVSIDVYFGTGAQGKRGAGFTGETHPISFQNFWGTSSGAGPGVGNSGATVVASNVTQGEIQFTWTPIGTAGADDSMQFDDVQLEPGILNTAYEYLPFEMVLRQCERHFCKTFPYATAPAQSAGLAGSLRAMYALPASQVGGGADWWFPSEMIATPAITTYNPSAANTSWRDVVNTKDVTVSVDLDTAKSAKGCPIQSTPGANTTGLPTRSYIHASADAGL
jgi:hypothetical protein